MAAFEFSIDFTTLPRFRFADDHAVNIKNKIKKANKINLRIQHYVYSRFLILLYALPGLVTSKKVFSFNSTS